MAMRPAQAPLPTVSTQAAPGVVDIRSSVDSFYVPGGDQGGVALQKAAVVAQGGADQLFKAGLADSIIQNNMAAKEIESQGIKNIQDLLYNGDDAFFKKIGRDAKVAFPDFEQRLDQIKIAAVHATGDNKYQTEKVLAAIDGHILTARGQMSSYANTQSREWEKGVVEGNVAANTNQAVAAASFGQEEVVQKSIDQARESAKQHAILTNQDPAVAANSAESRIRGTIAHLEMTKDPRKGLEYFEKYKDKFDSKTLETLDSLVNVARTEVGAQNLINKFAPNGAQAWYDAGIKNGFPAHVAAVFTGHASVESGFDTGAVRANDNKNSKTHPDSIGTFQWNDSRALKLKEKGDWKDLGNQQSHFFEELESTGTAAKLRASKTMEEANDIMLGFLRPAGYDPKTGAVTAVPSRQERLNRSKGFTKQMDPDAAFRDKTGDVLKNIIESDAPEPVKQRALTKYSQTTRIEEARRSSSIKMAADIADEAGLLAMEGKLDAGGLAARYDKAAGLAAEGADRSMVNVYKRLSAEAANIAGFAQMPLDMQKEYIAALQSGHSAKVAHIIISGDRQELAAQKAKLAEERTQNLVKANSETQSILKHMGDNLNPEVIFDKVKSTLQTYIDNKQPTKAEELATQYSSYAKAFSIANGGRINATNMETQLRGMIDDGRADPSQAPMLAHLERMNKEFEARFNADPTRYTMEQLKRNGLGGITVVDFSKPAELPAQLGVRIINAEAGRELNNRSIPLFTKAEMDNMSTALETGNVTNKQNLLKSLAVPIGQNPNGKSYFDKMATDLSAKGVAGTGYASAMYFYSKGDAASDAIAHRIVKGTDFLANSGDGGKMVAGLDEIWRMKVSDKLGDAISDAAGRPNALVLQTIRSLYAESVGGIAGAGAPTDVTKLDKAIEDTVGTPIYFNGRHTIAPNKGDNVSDMIGKIRLIPDSVVSSIRTNNGTPIQPWQLQTATQWVNIGDGLYEPRMKDNTRDGAYLPLRDPKTGGAWRVNLKTIDTTQTPSTTGQLEGAPDPGTGQLGSTARTIIEAIPRPKPPGEALVDRPPPVPIPPKPEPKASPSLQFLVPPKGGTTP